MNCSNVLRLAGLALAVTAAAGCGPSVGHVSGRVTVNGQPLVSGTVMFYADPDRGESVGRAVVENGEYVMDNVPVGPVRAVVISHARVPAGIMNPPGSAPKNDPANAAMAIPEKYQKPESTDKTFTVKPGRQQFHIQITP